jgi:hypothetical protein
MHQKRAGNGDEVAQGIFLSPPVRCLSSRSNSSRPALASWPGEPAELVALLVAH